LLNKYVQKIEEMKYKRIKNLRQYAKYTNEYEQLISKDLKKDQDVIDLLELLIEDFDNKTIEIIGLKEDMNPVELLKYLLNEHELTKSELARKLNVSRQLITEIVNYKRNISKKMVMKLSKYFNMMPRAFSYEYELVDQNRKLVST